MTGRPGEQATSGGKAPAAVVTVTRAKGTGRPAVEMAWRGTVARLSRRNPAMLSGYHAQRMARRWFNDTDQCGLAEIVLRFTFPDGAWEEFFCRLRPEIGCYVKANGGGGA